MKDPELKDPELKKVICPACGGVVFIQPTASAWCECGRKMVSPDVATRRAQTKKRVSAHRAKKLG